MAWTYAQTRRGYGNLWRAARIKPGADAALADTFAARIIAREARYKAVQLAVGVPWYFIGAIHMREASCAFDRVLHNGEKIVGTGRRTSLVPAGRGPFATWEEAAVDALRLKNLHQVTAWPVERQLYDAELYNGLGYTYRGVNSAYVWAGTNHEQPGKFVADPVSGGRGASAAADFAANKTIALPDLRGRVTAGKDDMGGSAASRLTAAVRGSRARRSARSAARKPTPSRPRSSPRIRTRSPPHRRRAAGRTRTPHSAVGGSHNHGGATTNDLQDHTHSGTTGDDSPDHNHTFPSRANDTVFGGNEPAEGGSAANQTITTSGASARHQHAFTTGGVNSNHTHGITVDGSHSHTITVDSGGAHVHALSGATDAAGSGSAHNNAQPSFIVNKIIKL